MQRHEDQMPTLLGLRETVRSQESIITNLEQSIKEGLAQKDKSRITAVDVNYQKLKNERNILREKDLQLRMLLSMNDGKLTREMVDNFKKDKMFSTDSDAQRILKAQANDLLSQIELLTSQLNEKNIKDFVEDTYEKNALASKWNPDKVVAKQNQNRRLDELEQQGDLLESELVEITKNSFQTISDLKYNLMTKNNLLLTKTQN